MSDNESTPGASEQQNASKAPVAAQDTEKQSKTERTKNLKNVAKASGFKAYITSEKHTIPIDVLVRGETVNGHWSAKDGYVEFLVPDHLVEGFEMHHHFLVGNIIVAE